MSEHLHAVLSPSSAHRWFACPGSVRESAGIPDETSEAAAEGTFAHEVAALCFKRGCDARAMIGHSDIVHTVDADMADHLQVYLDDVRSVDAAQVWCEVRVSLAGITDEVWGTLDYAAVERHRPVLHVWDLKFGAGVFVSSEDNPQVMIYGLALLLTFPQALAHVERVVFHVVQPRHHQGQHNKPVEMSVAQLRAWGEVMLREAVAAAKKPDAPLSAGEHCRFCRARPRCPELKRQTLQKVQHLFDDESLATPRAFPPPVQGLTPTELAVALRAFPVIEQWMSALREHAYNLAAGGTIVPGFKLVQKEGHRKWKNEAAAALALEAFLSHGKTPWTEPKLVSPAEAERRLPPAARGVVEELVTKPVTGSVLVPESDARPAINRKDVFNDGAVLPEK